MVRWLMEQRQKDNLIYFVFLIVGELHAAYSSMLLLMLLTFPECHKAARHLGTSPQLRNWIQKTSSKQFQGKAVSQDHLSRPHVSG